MAADKRFVRVKYAAATIERGRWKLEWSSESSTLTLYDAVRETDVLLSYTEMQDLRFCIAGVSEMKARDVKARNPLKETNDGTE